MAPSDLISSKCAARILRVHLSTIYRFIMSGKLKSWRRADSRYLVSKADVEGMLTEFVPPALPPRKGA